MPPRINKNLSIEQTKNLSPNKVCSIYCNNQEADVTTRWSKNGSGSDNTIQRL